MAKRFGAEVLDSDLLDIELAAGIQRLGGILSFSPARRNLAPPKAVNPPATPPICCVANR